MSPSTAPAILLERGPRRPAGRPARARRAEATGWRGRSGRRWAALGGIAVLVGTIAGCGDRPGGPATEAGGGGWAPSGALAVVDAPLPAAKAPPRTYVPASLTLPHKPHEGPVAGPAAGRQDVPTVAGTPIPDPPIAWAARPDPPKAAAPALDSKLGIISDDLPILAGRDGPFALVTRGGAAEDPGKPRADAPARRKNSPKGQMKARNADPPEAKRPEKPAPPPGGPPGPMGGPSKGFDVVDLRDGRRVGSFAYLADKLGPERLSPDARWLVTPGTSVPMPSQKPGTGLSVWQRGKPEPTASFRPGASVRWMEFLDDERLAVLAWDPRPALQVWEVATGKLARRIDLPPGSFVEPEVDWTRPTDETFLLKPSPSHAAISPGGKYVVLGGANRMIVVDPAEGTMAGDLRTPINASMSDYGALAFTADGSQIVAILKETLNAWSVETGKLTSSMAQILAGRDAVLTPGPTPGTLYYSSGWSRGESSGLFDIASGAGILGRNFAVLRRAGPKQVLGYGRLQEAPHVPLPKEAEAALGITERTTRIEAMKRVSEARSSDKYRTLFVLPENASGPMREADRKIEAYRKRLEGTAKRKQAEAEAALAQDKADHDVMEAIASPRPEPSPGDRAKVRPGKLQPPRAWALPTPPNRPAPAPMPADAGFRAWPLGFNETEAAVVVHQFAPSPVARYEPTWYRVDRTTGKSLGKPIRLWATARLQPGQPLNAPSPAPWVGALGLDGMTLAVCDPIDRSRVDVWDAEGKRIAGLRPNGADRAIDWVGFSPKGRLLTLGAGRLAAWALPTLEAVYDVEVGDPAGARMGPDRAWVAATAGGRVDFLDSDTGNCLGRVEAPGTDPRTLAVSPDGRTLALARAVEVPGPPPRGQSRTKPRLELLTFDLTDGRPSAVIPFGEWPIRGLHWLGNRRVLATDNRVVADLDAAAPVLGLILSNGGKAPYTYNSPRPMPGEPPVDLVADDPDGRLWGPSVTSDLDASVGGWRPARFVPTDKAESKAVLAADRPTFPFHPGATVRVEVGLGGDERSRKAAQRIAETLQDERFVLRRGGWTLRLGHVVYDTDQRLEVLLKALSNDNRASIPGAAVPGVREVWQLVDPAGKVAWSQTADRVFDEGPSRYQKSTSIRPGGATGLEQFTEYDFQGRPARDAMIGEILDRIGDAPSLLAKFPRAVLLTAEGYVALPVFAVLEIDRRPVPAR